MDTPDERGQTGRREGAAALGGSEPDAGDGTDRRAVRPEGERGALTHASFFSGGGGVDIGLHRAGWRTISFSEIDPYASAILEQRWPGVPNLGDVTALAHQDDGGLRRPDTPDRGGGVADAGSEPDERPADDGWRTATLWTGGFPCQDLSVAGKRAGLAGERSGLALTFLDLVREHRPRAVILENVPGLFSSNSGRDLGELLRRLGDLRYGWAYRVLDAQWFGLPQRRRRVFILALDLERHPDESSAAEVLAVGTRCERDHPQEREAWADAAGGARRGVANAIQASAGHHGHSSPRGDGSDNLVFNATARFGEWTGPDDVGRNVSARDYKSSNHLVVDGPPPDPDRVRATDGLAGRVDGSGGVDPEGLDSHRFRVVGNGVAAPVAEWLGVRLARFLDGV